MGELQAILKKAFARSTAHVIVAPTAKTADIPWEQWVRTYLGNYLDVLPYDNRHFRLLDYMGRMAERLVPLEDYTKAMEKHFPLDSVVDSLRVKAFLSEFATSSEEFKSLGLVYAYHR